LSSAHFVSCMHSTSGSAAASQRVTCGRRAMIELTFQVASFMSEPPAVAGGHVLSCLEILARPLPQAVLTSERSNQSRQQRPPHRNIIDDNMFVGRVRAVAFDAQSVEYRHAQRPDKVSIGSAAH